ncbi:MAG: class I SAM-dependent methyltransferase [Gemmatimonas sp.]|jgi:SAM-dependent methyltransferase|uniref:class I SAM-dependent methyltransferase n=1 Tax=Gemmatimonas sp. TaxID=1962908 RepID=UPI00391F1A27|nr:class I SAM-dependent methyltransferase [Gemmatimonadota bacterium]
MMTMRRWWLGPAVFGAAFACGATADNAPRTAGRVALAIGQDTIGPAAAPGAPAQAFPAPSRPVADIVAPRWTAEALRDDAGEFARVVRLAKIRAGMQVADIGAGDGYYVARLSPLVGATGRVFGQDIIPDYLTLLQRRVRREALANVQVVAGDPHDPRLPAKSVDVALMIHMYHEIEQPYALLWNLATAMRPGGTLVILDLERPTYGHGTPPDLLRCELRTVGYRERSFTRTALEEYVAVFEAPDSLSRPTPEAITAARRRTPCLAPRE